MLPPHCWVAPAAWPAVFAAILVADVPPLALGAPLVDWRYRALVLLVEEVGVCRPHVEAVLDRLEAAGGASPS